jgi:hypothetical protein
MGKVSKSKKRGGSSKSRAAAPYAGGGPSPARQDPTSAKLLQDLRSIDHARRQRACELLGSLFSGGGGGGGFSALAPMLSLEALASDELLNLLRMRLVDAHAGVQLAATRALRSMASCKDPAVYQRLERGGVAGSAVQLARAALEAALSPAPAPARLEHAETMLAALSSLCVWGESVVRELSAPAYVESLVALTQRPPSARLLCEAAALLAVLADGNPPALAVLAALPPARGVGALMDGMLGRTPPFAADAGTTAAIDTTATAAAAATEAARGDLFSSRLHCAATLSQFLCCGPAEQAAALEGALLGPLMDLLLGCLALSDEMAADCAAPDIVVRYEQASALPPADVAEGGGDGMETETAPTSDSRPEGSEDVTIGAEAAEKRSQAALGVVRLAAEILGNLALAAKEREGGGGGEEGGAGAADWATMDEDEGERLMDQMATSMGSGSAAQGGAGPGAAGLGGVYSALLDRGVLPALIFCLRRLLGVLGGMLAGSRGGACPLPSSVLDLLETLETVLLCLGNLLDCSPADVLAGVGSPCAGAGGEGMLAELLAAAGQAALDALYGVTPSATAASFLPAPDSALPGPAAAAGGGAGAGGEWALSSCLDGRLAALGSRQACVAAAHALACLYGGASSARLMPAGGDVVSVSGVSGEAPGLLPLLLRLLGLPVVEVLSAACALVARLAGARGGGALSQAENMALSQALARRLADPKAVSAGGGGGGGGTLQVSAACFSALVDLHCSDEPAYLEVFAHLNLKGILNESLADFKTKLAVEGPTIEREELGGHREMALNVKRFIKYKSGFL